MKPDAKFHKDSSREVARAFKQSYFCYFRVQFWQGINVRCRNRDILYIAPDKNYCPVHFLEKNKFCTGHGKKKHRTVRCIGRVVNRIAIECNRKAIVHSPNQSQKTLENSIDSMIVRLIRSIENQSKIIFD